MAAAFAQRGCRVFAADADVSATPAVLNGRLYFPSWGGSLYCLNATSGAIIWQKSVEALLRAGGVEVRGPVTLILRGLGIWRPCAGHGGEVRSSPPTPGVGVCDCGITRSAFWDGQ